MYTAGELTEDYTSGRTYTREIRDPEGDIICYTIEDNGNTWQTDALLSHLNRF